MRTDEAFPFLKYGKVLGMVSFVLTMLSLIYLTVRGLPYGIDFSGGAEIQIQFQQEISLDLLRSEFRQLKWDGFTLQQFGSTRDYLVRFQLSGKADEKERAREQNDKLLALSELLKSSALKGFGGEVVRVDSVGPQVGRELRRAGVLSVFYSLLIILVYIAMRFDYQYAPGAVLCLIHDVAITLAVFVLSGREIQLSVIAAVLTLIGYSLNDTIVVFDRIREVARLQPKWNFEQVANWSLTKMWKRTVVTSGTTLAVSLALFLFTGGAISDIAFILSVGILVGTYSSLYVATPITGVFERWLKGRDWRLIPKPKFSESSYGSS